MDGQSANSSPNYGPIGGIWFDGMWDKPDAGLASRKNLRAHHQLQPAALIIPNHHQTPKTWRRVQTFERDIPGQNSAGFKHQICSEQCHLESSNTLNGSWDLISRQRLQKPEEVEEMLCVRPVTIQIYFSTSPAAQRRNQEEFVTRLMRRQWLHVTALPSMALAVAR